MKIFDTDKKRLSRIAWVMAVSLFLSGCAGNVPFMGREQGAQEDTAPAVETLGLEPDFSYEKKTEKPNIQVDRLGYLPKSAKTAVLSGAQLPERFQIMKKDSGECVYEGEVRQGEEKIDGTLTGYCVFTDLEEEGTYYIQCDKIGCSYYFTVGKEAYLEKEQELGRLIEEMSSEGGTADETEDICKTLSCLLAAYEMYPGLLMDIWGDEKVENESLETDGEDFFRMLRSETDRLLSLQDEKSGGIYKRTDAALQETKTLTDDQEISGAATAAFAGTMAKYSYLYQQYDWDYANICLKAAAKAWRYLNVSQSGGKKGQVQPGTVKGGEDDTDNADSLAAGKFYAASELYRASNEAVYHNYILQNQDLIFGQNEDFYLLMGKEAYLSTRRKVDQELCGQIMDGLMKEAGRITERTKAQQFLADGEEADAVLWNMMIMSLANYAVMNHEYVTVIENNVHYLMGRNAEGEFLADHPERGDAAALLLLFSVVEAEREIIEASENEGYKQEN